MSGDVYEFSAILLLEDAIESDPNPIPKHHYFGSFFL